MIVQENEGELKRALREPESRLYLTHTRRNNRIVKLNSILAVLPLSLICRRRLFTLSKETMRG